MTPAQHATVKQLLSTLQPGRAHHGDCIGADDAFHDIARKAGWWMVGHPPQDTEHQAGCTFDEVRPPYKHLRRNCNIVDAVTHLIAAPLEFYPQVRGGTWFTIRRAQKMGRAVAIVVPDGRIQFESWA
jgi:hypothetical protein